MSEQNRQGFWREVFARQGSIIPHVLPLVLTFGVIAIGVWLLARVIEKLLNVWCALEIMPFEFAGVALGVLLVFRTTAGYDRWWEARKLWGGFVDRTRNLVISALSYGPSDPEWRDKFVRWVAVYPHVCRHILRGERPGSEVNNLLGSLDAESVAAAQHMPVYVSARLAELLRVACDRFGMDRFTFLQLDRERVLLIDNFGGCERIRNTPVPKAYSLKIRHFIFLFLVSLPIALLHRLESDWLIPLITMLVAYPLVSLDQLGVELENPFSTHNLSHLPLNDLCTTIEQNLFAVLKAAPHNSPP